MKSESDSIQIRSEGNRDYGYVAEYSRTLGAHTAVSTDSDDANPIARCRAGRPPMQAIPISDEATGNLGRVQGDRGFEDCINVSASCGDWIVEVWWTGEEEKDKN